MKKIATILTVCALGLVFVSGALCEERASKKDATDMVKKAVAAFKQKGEKAFVEFTAPSKTFTLKDLYVVAYDTTGKCLAHGQNAKLVGNSLIELKDADGKEFVKERVELVKTKDNFWQEYKFTDPLTKRILPKEAYCEKANATTIICGGVYKD